MSLLRGRKKNLLWTWLPALCPPVSWDSQDKLEMAGGKESTGSFSLGRSLLCSAAPFPASEKNFS